MEKEKKIVLINPPQINCIDDHLDPPLGLMYIASSLKQKGIDVSISDLSGVPIEQGIDSIPDSNLYGITLFSASFNTSKKIASKIKKRNNDAKIIVGGPHATSLPMETLSFQEFDYLVKGEGELVMPKIVDSFYSGKEISKIIQTTPITNLDSLPFPARDLVNIKEYNRHVEGENATSMVTSRGCPYTCNFCCKDVHGKKIRFRSVENVLKEISESKETYDIDSFIFYDDVFTFGKKRLESLCNGIKELNITFRCNGRVGINDYEDYQRLKEAGCMEIAFGIESGSQDILDKINKGTTVKKNFQSIKDAKKAGLLTKAYLVVGFPGETQKSVDATKRLIYESQVDKCTAFAFIPLPGCDVWKNPKKYGISWISEDWDQYFNIAGNYEGGVTFKTDHLTPKQFTKFHQEIANYILTRGQKGTVEEYYKSIKISD